MAPATEAERDALGQHLHGVLLVGIHKNKDRAPEQLAASHQHSSASLSTVKQLTDRAQNLNLERTDAADKWRKKTIAHIAE